MERRKDIGSELRETIDTAYQYLRYYIVPLKRFAVHHFTVKKIIYKWKTLKTVYSLPNKFTSKF